MKDESKALPLYMMKRRSVMKYASESAFLKDSAYAIFGQTHRLTGNSAPVDTKTGKQLTMDQYMAKVAKSKQFKEFLRSETNPNKYMTPRSVAQIARDPEILKKTVNEKQKDLSKNASAINASSKVSNAPETEPKL